MKAGFQQFQMSLHLKFHFTRYHLYQVHAEYTLVVREEKKKKKKNNINSLFSYECFFLRKFQKTSSLTFVFQVKTSCCHTNVRMKMQVKLIGSAIQQCWHSCTWKNKSYGINCSMLIYQSLILKRHNQDWIRQAHFLLIMCVEISNILCSVLFSPEAARKFWLQVMILRGYVTTIKQDPTVFRWNFIDLDRKRRKQKKIT